MVVLNREHCSGHIIAKLVYAKGSASLGVDLGDLLPSLTIATINSMKISFNDVIKNRMKM